MSFIDNFVHAATNISARLYSVKNTNLYLNLGKK